MQMNCSAQFSGAGFFLILFRKGFWCFCLCLCVCLCLAELCEHLDAIVVGVFFFHFGLSVFSFRSRSYLPLFIHFTLKFSKPVLHSIFIGSKVRNVVLKFVRLNFLSLCNTRTHTHIASIFIYPSIRTFIYTNVNCVLPFRFRLTISPKYTHHINFVHLIFEMCTATACRVHWPEEREGGGKWAKSVNTFRRMYIRS